jgi:hypothetical protein
MTRCFSVSTGLEEAPDLVGAQYDGKSLRLAVARDGLLVTDVGRPRESGLAGGLANALRHSLVSNCRENTGGVVRGGTRELLGLRAFAQRSEQRCPRGIGVSTGVQKGL